MKEWVHENTKYTWDFLKALSIWEFYGYIKRAEKRIKKEIDRNKRTKRKK